MSKVMIIDLTQYLRLKFFQSAWLKRNKHNLTRAMTIFPIQNVTVGRGAYGPLNVRTYNKPQEKLKIGHYCSIAKDVVFMLSGEHPLNRISTYPFDAVFFDTDEKVAIS